MNLQRIIKDNKVLFYDSLWEFIAKVACDDVKMITEQVIPSIPSNINKILKAFRNEHGPRYVDIVMQVIHEMQKESFLKSVQQSKKQASKSKNQRNLRSKNRNRK